MAVPDRIKRRRSRDLAKEAALFGVLSDPHRLCILSTLACTDEVCVCDINCCVPLLQPTVSHHLRVLKAHGLVDSERRGTWVYYRLAAGAQERLRAALGAVTSRRQSA